MKEKQSLTETLRHLGEAREERLEGSFERFEQIVRSADLDTMVRQALSSSTAIVRDVSIRQVQHGIGVGTAVYIVEGTADERGQVRPWAIVLKTLAKQPGQEDERGPFYWKREAEFFASSLSQEIHTGLRPPRCYAVQSISADEIALWLEYVPHRTTLWTDEQFYRAARKVGQFNGCWYQVDHKHRERWMNEQCGWLEPWFPLADGWLDTIETQWESLLELGVSFGDDFLPQLRRGLKGSQANVHIYKSAPQTLCHFDAHQGNLLWNDERPEDLVAIDWAYVGPGALGQDIAVMIVQRTNADKDFAPARLRAFSEDVYRHYVEGLREAGWDGSGDEIRVGYLAYATIFWVGAAVQTLSRALRRDQSEQAAPYTLKDTVTYQWEYFRQCASELEALTG
jgi:thiamine kinase-like enzyme